MPDEFLDSIDLIQDKLHQDVMRPKAARTEAPSFDAETKRVSEPNFAPVLSPTKGKYTKKLIGGGLAALFLIGVIADKNKNTPKEPAHRPRPEVTSKREVLGVRLWGWQMGRSG